MKKQVLSRVLAIGLSAAMTCTTLPAMNLTTVLAKSNSKKVQETVLENFENPDYQAKPMVRWWFPDAWAGEDANDMIDEYIDELVDAGYGGVEVTMMVSGTKMNNDDLSKYGWGSENWVKLLKKVLKKANTVKEGFTVDITLTAHWPTVINSIDPNDSAASQELLGANLDVTAENVVDNKIVLPMPATKTQDSTDALTACPFIFTDTLQEAYLIKGDGTGNYDFATAICVTDDVVTTGSKAAGVPDEATCEEYGLDYQRVLDIYGEAPAEDADLSVSYNGKMDAEGHRARMADTQYEYSLDLSKLSDDVVEGINNGEYTLIGTYVRGTGQVMSDGPFGGASDAMVSRTYVTNYFSKEATNLLTDYWEENIIDDELRALLEENGSCIFEDSIEAGTKSGGSFWSDEVEEKFAEEYGDVFDARMVPLILTNVAVAEYDGDVEMPWGGTMHQHTDAVPGVISNDAETSEVLNNVSTSYQIVLGDLYDTEHSQVISDWAKSFNYKYRAQCYAVTGQDICGSAMAVDIPEGDNSSKGDGLRKFASVINVEDKEAFSMEAVTATGNGKLNWADVVTEVGQNFSDGVNHVVLHGCPYTKSCNGFIADWPGWTAFGNNFAGSYALWRADWDDMYNLTGYMARNQAVLQTGTAKVDVAFLNDTTTGASLSSGNSFQNLLDAGYSYNLFTEALLESDNMTVEDGVLAADGPAYKALVVNNVSTISVDGLKKVQEIAEAGLPVIFYDSNISSVYGLETEDNNAEDLKAVYEEIVALDNVAVVETKDEVKEMLEAMDVEPAASYDQGYLETSHYEDEESGSDYYYMFHDPETAVSNTSMANGKATESYKTAEKLETVVTLEGEGVPYELDAWTGDVTPIAEYTENADGTVSVEVELEGGESTIIALLNTKKAAVHADVTEDGDFYYDKNGKLVYTSETTGETTFVTSDGMVAKADVEAEADTLDLTDGWRLTIDSYGPSAHLNDEDNIDQEMTANSSTGNTVYIDPTLTDITTESFNIDTLVSWSDIAATDDQLAELGVSAMSEVSGVGYYTNTFKLPSTWDAKNMKYVLNLEYQQDEIASVTVNGVTVDGIDNVADKVDITGLLKKGKNTIVIKLDTPMFNRMKASGRQAIGRAGDMNMSNMSPAVVDGLTSVTITATGSSKVVSVAKPYTVKKGTKVNVKLLKTLLKKGMVFIKSAKKNTITVSKDGTVSAKKLGLAQILVKIGKKLQSLYVLVK